MRIVAGVVLLMAVITGCGVAKSSFNPNRKYSPQQLDKDYSIFQQTLEENHPGLYWYTPKDSMDYYFEWGRQQIRDSMTEPEFRKVISFILAKIKCGHTTSRPSKNFSRYLDTTRNEKIFPLSFKFWDDTTVVTGNLNRNDKLLTRGLVVNSVNNMDIDNITRQLFQYISSDGINTTHKFQTLSNRGGFGSLYSSVYGRQDKYSIGYTDSVGQKHVVTVPTYEPSRDSSMLAAIGRLRKTSPKERKQQRLQNSRSLKIDTAARIAFMDVNTFGRGVRLKKFFRQSFRLINFHDIKYLVIDLRSNGGGSVTNSTTLSRYLVDKKFKVADSLYSLRRRTHFSKYIEKYWLNKLFMLVFTRKKKDGHYHFRYYERHYFKPKEKNHFDGKAYLMTGGNSFSATTLFANSVREQENVVIVGEETGGGAYGNTAWLIPDVKLPETKIQFRLPLFRLVIDKNIPKDGRGIQPEVEARPSVKAIKNNEDYKLTKVMELIDAERKKR